MTDPQPVDRVRDLRARGCTPKQIARVLRLRPAEVTALLRKVAKEDADAAGPPALVGCWVNNGWSGGLTVRGHTNWPGLDFDEPAAEGMVSVLVARRHRYDKVSVCGFLVDVYCLGVKNAVPPRVMDELELRTFRQKFFRAYLAAPVAAPLDLAQQVVFGAVDYARRLGFEPHPDFAAAVDHLGTYAGPFDIDFGLEGKPYYVQGPYDDTRRIMRTLQASAGQGNYHFTAELPVGALVG